ncbi:MAG: hypothetical protein KGH93_00560 [Patescibacteria group bacterium]|nr:hypothetical protein [Patescibacteria group bacterium]MDE1945682.1 hypothetical protein [Patescibacteria group bacterium]
MKTTDRYPEMTDIPAWYELAMKNRKTLAVPIHRKAVDFLHETIRADIPVVPVFQKEFHDHPSFQKFTIPDGKSKWGFADCLAPLVTEDPSWGGYVCELPAMFGALESEKDLPWAVRATLAILFTALWLFEGDTKCDRPQLMLVEGLRVDREMYGGALSVTLTPAVSRWLSRQEDHSSLVEVERAMQKTDRHLWNNPRFIPRVYEFRAACRQPKWINLTVPGNACGLDPSSYSDETPERGYCLAPHNTDSSIQQLTLLAGLAKLHELVRRDKTS